LLPYKQNTHNRHQPKQSPENKQRWTTFTYIGKETTYISNIFKHSNILITYLTNNTLQNHLTHNTHIQIFTLLSVQINLTWLQEGIHRTNWQNIHNKI
jgi:hypothetical protein